jgi:hypothetical protein
MPTSKNGKLKVSFTDWVLGGPLVTVASSGSTSDVGTMGSKRKVSLEGWKEKDKKEGKGEGSENGKGGEGKKRKERILIVEESDSDVSLCSLFVLLICLYLSSCHLSDKAGVSVWI